jgi:hypothetical protein
MLFLPLSFEVALAFLQLLYRRCLILHEMDVAVSGYLKKYRNEIFSFTCKPTAILMTFLQDGLRPIAPTKDSKMLP